MKSGISAVLVAIGFFFPLYPGGVFEAIHSSKGAWQDYAALFVWYYANFFLGIFFNGALAACAGIRLSGGDPRVGDGLRIAFSRIGRIALWGLISGTVGLFLSSVRQRGKWILRLLGASLGLAWSLIAYTIVPVILFEDRGVYDSIYRSEELFQGEQVAGGFGSGLLSFKLRLPAFPMGGISLELRQGVGHHHAGLPPPHPLRRVFGRKRRVHRSTLPTLPRERRRPDSLPTSSMKRWAAASRNCLHPLTPLAPTGSAYSPSGLAFSALAGWAADCIDHGAAPNLTRQGSDILNAA